MNDMNWFSGDMASELPPSDLARWAAADAINYSVSTAPRDPVADVQADKAKEPSKNDAAETSQLNFVQRSVAISSSPMDVQLVIHPVHAERSIPDDISQAKSLFDCIESIQQLPKEDFVLELSGLHRRDVPIILALLPVHTAQVLSIHLQSDAPKSSEEAFFNPDPKRFFGPKGLGYLVEYTYWQMLEAGFRIAPSAASHFRSDGKTHHGYNRVYTWLHPEQTKTPETWLRNYREGFSFVTNGPLLRMTANGQPPGGVLQGTSGQSIYTDLQTDLTVRDEVDYLDIIFNGQTKYQAKLQEHARRGKFPELAYNESGWMIMRVITAHNESYRFASTAPTYFEFDGQRRISRKAVAYFQDWLTAIQKSLTSDPAMQERYQPYLIKAKRFWTERMLEANAP